MSGSVSVPSVRRLIALISGALLVAGLLAFSAPSAQAKDQSQKFGAYKKPAHSGNVRAAAAGTGHITGTVTKPNGTPDPNVDVYVFTLQDGQWLYDDYYAATETNGTYDVEGLPDGTYRLQFEDYGSAYAPEFYNDKTTVESADDIVVAGGAMVSGKNAQLGAAGFITGRVIAPNGVGLDSIDIVVLKQVGAEFQFVNVDYTDDAGYYQLGLAPGTYRLLYSDELEEYAQEFYKNVDNPDDATDVTVTAGAQTPVATAMLGTVVPNQWKSTAKVTVSANRHGNVSVSCTQACKGYAQVWSDETGTEKSSAKYFSLTKAGYTTLAFTDLPYVNSTTAKVRIAKTAPDEMPNPQFNTLELVKGPQNVLKTTASVKVSSTDKATVNVSCTMACEGYAQLRSDEAGTHTSKNVVHYKLTKAGFAPMYFTGVPNIDSATWVTRLAVTTPSTMATPQFNPLTLVRTPVPVNTLKTTPKVTVSSNGTATVNLSCTVACEGYVQLWKTEAGTNQSSNIFHYKLTKAGYVPMLFKGLIHENSTEWKTRVAITSPATTTTPIFLPLEFVAGS